LLSILFSDVLTFHITNTSGLALRFIKPIFEVAIGLFSKMNPRVYVISPLCSRPGLRNLDASLDQTLLLFVVTPIHTGVSLSQTQPLLIAELERLWVEQSKPPELADHRLYDHFDVSFMTASLRLGLPEWAKVDVSKQKARFLDKNRADYAFQPRYQKKIAIGKLGLCMERLWVRWYHTICNISHLYVI
jgi:hypothetical protein